VCPGGTIAATRYNVDMLFEPMTPVVVRVIEAPTRETTVADILLGAVGFVGAVLLGAVLVGVLAGAIFIAVRKRCVPGRLATEQAEGLLHLSSLER
jgi:hypothetical protein